MSDFVNPNQRSVSLPPGCKDLIDVLQPESAIYEQLKRTLEIQRQAEERAKNIEITRRATETIPLAQFEKYARMLFERDDRSFMLTLKLGERKLGLNFHRDLRTLSFAGGEVQEGSPEEQLLRPFIAACGGSFRTEYDPAPPKPHWDVPVLVLFTLPTAWNNAESVKAGVTDLLRACNASETTMLEVTYTESKLKGLTST
jgi:hypothetical protein